MTAPQAAPFIFNLTVHHPPYFTVTSQFIKDDREAKIQYFITCQRPIAKDLYLYAKVWTKFNHGSVRQLDESDGRPSLAIIVPIVWQSGQLDSPTTQPGAFFLVNCGSLVWNLSRLLEEQRIRDMLRKKYGPKDLP